MFKSKAKEDSARNDAPNAALSCIIAKGTSIEGKVTTTEDFRVDGHIKGDIQCDKRFVMGETGRIEGTIECLDSSIKGTIDGTISVRGLLHLLGTAMIKGKIIANKMIVDEGAAYNGECLIGEHNFKK